MCKEREGDKMAHMMMDYYCTILGSRYNTSRILS